MSVQEAMSTAVVTVTAGEPAARAADLLVEHNLTGLPVVDPARHVVGIVSDLDLITELRHGVDLDEATVAEVMDVRPLFVEPQTDLETVVDLMEEWRVWRLPVCEAGRVVGVISRGDVLRVLHTRDAVASRAPIADRSAAMEVNNLADLYGLPPIDWARITTRLDGGLTQAPDSGGPNRHTCWLATINPDGSPHVTGIGALWVDGTFWFETGIRTRKGRNLDRDPRCTLSVATRDFDLVVEGEAHRVTDPAVVNAMAERWAAEGWPARVDESGAALTAEFSAPSAGPPPWFIYRLTPRTATALLTAPPGGATRWRFFDHAPVKAPPPALTEAPED